MAIKTFPTGFARRCGRVIRNDQIVLSVLAVIVGVVAAYASIGFRLGIDLVQRLGFGFSGETVYTSAGTLAWWHVALVPVAGGLVVGLILQFMLPDKRQQGVPQVIAAMRLKAGYLRFRDAASAALVSIVALGSGSSTGREGPMVHLGASLASMLAHRLHLGPDLARAILACGVASAVAASFNAPIAGVFFALEVVVGHYAMSTFMPVVIAGVAGTMVTRIHLGELPAFIIPEHAIISFLELPAYIILGIVCAVIAISLVRAISFAEDVSNRLQVPVWIRPAAAGLLIGMLAITFPHILGVGYQTTDAALNELFPLWLLLVLIIVKCFATAVSIGARFGAGIFSPSLAIGALTGGAYGLIAAKVFPELAATHGAYALVGMSAMAGAVLGAPISTIFMVFELTGDYKMTIATMIATSTASIIAQQALGGSFFLVQLKRLGVELSSRARRVVEERVCKVDEVMSQEFTRIPGSAALDEIVVLCRKRRDWHICVVDGERLIGAFRSSTLRDLILDEREMDQALSARDLVGTSLPTLTPDMAIMEAINRLEDSASDYLPVVDPGRDDILLGIVQYKHAMQAQDALLKQMAADVGRGVDD